MEETAGDDKTLSIAHLRSEIESGSEKATESASASGSPFWLLRHIEEGDKKP